ncbi:hypothetical protein GASC598I20_004180, partial [Gilliamella apicola SCGC AB-598-I20]
GLDQSIEHELDSLDSDTTTTTNNSNNKPAYLEDGYVISNTKPAMVIEDLIGQFLYSVGGSSAKDNKQDTNESKE